jgi:hypothetical protein
MTIRIEAPKMRELTDEELSVVHGGGIGAFLTQLGKDISQMLSTGQVIGGRTPPKDGELDRFGAMGSGSA